MKCHRMIAAIFPLLLTGCGAMSSSGPSMSDVESGADIGGDASSYILVDVDGRTISQTTVGRSPGFLETFGENGGKSGASDLRIGIGDTVSVTVWEVGGGLFAAAPAADPSGVPGLRGSNGSSAIPGQAVGSDGCISVPFAGRVRVAGLTPAKAEAAIRSRLADKAADPQVLVTITNNISGTVSIMGEVGGGARLPLSVHGERILDIIAMAGGIKTAVHDTRIHLSRDGRTVTVPLKTLFDDPRENIYVRPDDIITVSRETQKLTVLGATLENSEMPFEAPELSLAQAIGKAKGLIDSRSDAAGVFVFRYEPIAIAQALDPYSPLLSQGRDVPVVYRLSLADPAGFFAAQRFMMRDGDVLYVSNASTHEIQKVLGMFGALTAPVVTGANLYATGLRH